jgi:hypothetical protein
MLLGRIWFNIFTKILQKNAIPADLLKMSCQAVDFEVSEISSSQYLIALCFEQFL